MMKVDAFIECATFPFLTTHINKFKEMNRKYDSWYGFMSRKFKLFTSKIK